MAAEGCEMLLDQRHLRQPAFDIDVEQFFHLSARDVEPRGVEIGHVGNSSDGGVFGMGLHLTVAALEDPLQHAAVFTITGPEEFSLFIFILAKPVDVENLWQLRWICERSYLEPVGKVVAHVIAAEGEHGHGIAAQLSDFSRDRGRGLAADGCAEESAMLPVEGFRDERNNSGAPAAEQDGIDWHTLRVFPLGSDYRALTQGSGKARVRVRCFPA